MKRFLSIFIFCLLALSAYAQGNGELYAKVLQHEASFTLNSPSSGVLKVLTRVEVLDRKGLDAAAFVLYSDSFRSLSAFAGKIEAGGKVLKKLKTSDVKTVSAADGIASDASVSYYEPAAPYPFTVEYEYEVAYRKGLISFPSFIPVSDPDVSAEKLKYTLTVPAGREIQFYASKDPEKSSDGKKDVYVWDFGAFEGYVYEHMRPSIFEEIPFVYSAPVEFEYAGTKGSQKTWTESGLWLYSLQKDVLAIPDELRQKVNSLVSGISSEKQKIRILYDFLRENTRYVSIQLGLGGLKPFSVEAVSQTGFGDCKALSVYMQALLEIAGIPSEYVVVNTSRSRLIPDYHTVGQMDHAMLCVPMDQDSLWVECTNPRLPLGYAHESVAGHEVLLVTDEGGKKVRVADYPDSLRVYSESVTVNLNEDASASCVASRHLLLDAAEPYVGFAALDSRAQFDALMGGTSLSPSEFKLLSVEDNFTSWVTMGEDRYVPEASVSYSFDVANYGKLTAGRIFLPLNPFSKRLSADRTERVNDFIRGTSRTYADTVVFVLPQAYVPESMPESSVIESPFGRLATELTYTPADMASATPGKIVVVQKLELFAGRFSRERYADYRTFARNVSRAYDSKIVLTSNS